MLSFPSISIISSTPSILDCLRYASCFHVILVPVIIECALFLAVKTGWWPIPLQALQLEKRWTKFGFSNPTIGYIYMRTYMWFSKSQSWIVMVQMTPVRIHKNHKNQQTYHRLSSYLVILTIPIIVCIFGKSMNSDSVLLYNQSDWPILENP